MELCLENVMEDSPEMLLEIVESVADPRLRLCLDVGHANTEVSSVPLSDWADVFLPYLSHVHLHNNMGGCDFHSCLGSGTAPIADIIEKLESKRTDLTYTLESMLARPSVDWLIRERFLTI